MITCCFNDLGNLEHKISHFNLNHLNSEVHHFTSSWSTEICKNIATAINC